MGHGSYSYTAHEALTRMHAAKPAQQVFKQRSCHALMDPKGVRVRECFDSEEHPCSLGIAFALDVTGSMGDIPRQLAQETLPSFMKILTAVGVPDPQLLFMAVGDATCDRAPLQVGQFESTGELMDRWLTYTFLEGGGGGSNQESYELAMYFLAQHVDMHCLSKRNKRGYMFLTGDEHPYDVLSRHTVEAVIGDRLDGDLKVEEIVAELSRSFVPFFLIPDEGRRRAVERRWRDLLGEHVLCLSNPREICAVAAGAIMLNERLVADVDGLATAFDAAGIEKPIAKPAVRALAPFAASLDGAAVLATPKPGIVRKLWTAVGGK